MKNGLYLTDCFFIVSVLYSAFLADIFSYKRRFIFSLLSGIYLSDYYVFFSN